jgi:hypothetical protein
LLLEASPGKKFVRSPSSKITKCLLCNHEVLNSNPNSPKKSQNIIQKYIYLHAKVFSLHVKHKKQIIICQM